jgi:hypothetical protein
MHNLKSFWALTPLMFIAALLRYVGCTSSRFEGFAYAGLGADLQARGGSSALGALGAHVSGPVLASAAGPHDTLSRAIEWVG